MREFDVCVSDVYLGIVLAHFCIGLERYCRVFGLIMLMTKYGKLLYFRIRLKLHLEKTRAKLKNQDLECMKTRSAAAYII